MIDSPSRRLAFGRIGGVLAALSSAPVLVSAAARTSDSTSAAGTLAELTRQLKQVPRKRQFKTVPFMLTQSSEWDEQAARLLLDYGHPAKQVWENTELAAGWPALMREAMNGEVFAHRHPDFLQVAAMHGLAHLALFSDETWAAYQLGRLAGPPFATNTLIHEKAGVSPSDDLQDMDGFYGPNNNNIASLQRRGAVFVACHDSIHAIARRLQQAAGPDSELGKTPAGVIAADLTNNLIADCVLVPSVVAFLVELQRSGFTYAKGS